MNISQLIKKPIVLNGNNFTPLTQTPWAGNKISKFYKSNSQRTIRIGESWEVSFVEKKPSFIFDSDIKLSCIIEEMAQLLNLPLSRSFDILVKIIDAKDPLSVQLHPKSNFNVGSNNCTKHESWFILKAEKGAGIYLGLKDFVNKENLEEAIKSGKDLSKFLNFFPVQEGDYFDIPPGIIHAIGDGITLLEPQKINATKNPVTYRVWDWNRKYDKNGEINHLTGKKRELHLKEFLLNTVIEEQFLHNINALKKEVQNIQKFQSGELSFFPSNEFYQVINGNILKEAKLNISIQKGYLLLITLSGKLKLKGDDFSNNIEKGFPVILTEKIQSLIILLTLNSNFILVAPTFSLWNLVEI